MHICSLDGGADQNKTGFKQGSPGLPDADTWRDIPTQNFPQGLLNNYKDWVDSVFEGQPIWPAHKKGDS